MTGPKLFRGLNNTADSIDLGHEWLKVAQNVHVTDQRKLAKRKGYERVLAASRISGAYATHDGLRAYLIDAGVLKAVMGPASAPTTVTLATGLSTAQAWWDELNGEVYFNNGEDAGIITSTHELRAWTWPVPVAPALSAAAGSMAGGQYQVRCTFTLPDGRMTGASDVATLVLADNQALQITHIPQAAGLATNVFIAPANSAAFGLAATSAPAALRWDAKPTALGRALVTKRFSPLPQGCTVIQSFRGRMYAAMPMDGSDPATALWESEPMQPHLFNLRDKFRALPGTVTMLAPTRDDRVLVIGTDRAVWGWDGTDLKKLAEPCAVVPGRHWHVNEAGDVIFWTERGLCSAPPFAYLTERQVSVAPGRWATGAIVSNEGQVHYQVAIQQGGAAFNSRND